MLMDSKGHVIVAVAIEIDTNDLGNSFFFKDEKHVLF